MSLIEARQHKSSTGHDGLTTRRAHIVWRLGALIRPLVTLGVRCLVLDEADKVLLVRHTYTSGWHFPGGGVDAHESTREAAMREVREETGLTLAVPPEFFALFFNRALAGRDHVALFVAADVPAIDDSMLRIAGPEIAEVKAFPRTALPPGTSGSAHRRLAEWSGEAPIPQEW